MRMGRRKTRTSGVTRTTTYGSRGKPAQPARISKGKVLPAQPAVPATPTTTTTTPGVTEVSDVQVNTPKPGTPGGVMSGAVLLLGLGLLYATSTTNPGGVNVWDFLFNPNTKVTKSQLAQPMSMLMLVIIMAIFADLSPAIGGLSILALTGFWIVWSVENPTALANLLNKLSFGTSNKSTGTSSTATTAGTATL